MSFYRYPSPLECSYLALDTFESSPLVNQFIVVGKGEIDQERLQRAADQALAKNPGFNLKLKGFWGWRYWDDQGFSPTITTLYAPDWNSYFSVGAPKLGDPIDVRHESPCQIHQIHADNGTHLLFRTHHAITDGRGTLHFMNEVFRALRGDPLLGSTSKVTEWDIAKRNFQASIDSFENNSIAALKGTLEPEKRGYQWCRIDWAGNKNKLTAKLIQAVSELAREGSDQANVALRVPSDLRRYLDDDEGLTIANCTGAIDLNIQPDSTVDSVRKELVRAMRHKRDLMPFKPHHKYSRWLPRAWFQPDPHKLMQIHESKRYRMTGTISYLGEVDIKAFSCDKFESQDFFGVPIPFENRSVFIAACHYLNKTNIIIGCPTAIANLSELEQFSTQLGNRLDKISSPLS